jgi:hypothetical protein
MATVRQKQNFLPKFLNSGQPLSAKHSRIPTVPPSEEVKKHI